MEMQKASFLFMILQKIFSNIFLTRSCRLPDEKLGAFYKVQAHPRDINLFYLLDYKRERIEYKNERFEVVHTGLSFSKEQMLEELNTHPERFSPNVILRPLYQESILPNIAYTGGGGEIAYWLERKDQFEHAGVHYPMLLRRNSLFRRP